MGKPVKEDVKTKSEAGEELVLHVRYPTSRNYEDAKIEYSKKWTELVFPEDKSKAVKTQKQINAMLEENGVWTQADKDKEKALAEELIELGKRLRSGKTETGRKMTKKEGRDLAVAMHNKRTELDNHTASRNSYVVHSAEGIAEAKRFDYLMSVCVLDGETGEPYFKGLDNYDERKDEKAAWDAARKLAEMIYGTDFSENIEDNLMEIQFLKRFGFVDEKGNYVDPKTKERVDASGKPLKEEEIDTDVFGNPIKDGKVIVEFGDFADDEEAEAASPPPEDKKKNPPQPISSPAKPAKPEVASATV